MVVVVAIDCSEGCESGMRGSKDSEVAAGGSLCSVALNWAGVRSARVWSWRPRRPLIWEEKGVCGAWNWLVWEGMILSLLLQSASGAAAVDNGETKVRYEPMGRLVAESKVFRPAKVNDVGNPNPPAAEESPRKLVYGTKVARAEVPTLSPAPASVGAEKGEVDSVHENGRYCGSRDQGGRIAVVSVAAVAAECSARPPPK